MQARMQTAGFYFDDFFVDARNRQLWRQDEVLPLNSKYFDVLLLLVSEGGRLVEKQRIFEEIWKDVFVTDAALTQCIKDIRKQLGDDAANPRYIKTIPKHGYRFIGSVMEAPASASDASRAGHLASSPSSSSMSSPSGQLSIALPGQAAAIAPRPYKFLDYYTEQDTRFFFGREAEVESISSQILARRSFILHGRSGVGKSSILRAGVQPRLKDLGHQVFVIRSFTDPLQQMVAALVAEAGSEDEAADEAIAAANLKTLIQRATTAATAADARGQFVVFFLDQFEEFFLLLDEESRQHFIAVLGELLADASLRVKFVFALREDFLAEMSQFKTAIPEIFHHEFRLKRLSREQAARAITEPALAVGCRYEAALVERLLDDLSDRDGIDPPQLQIVCDRLFDSKDGEGNLTVASYDESGTASQILASYLERVLLRFNAADLQAAKSILTSLISSDGRRLVLRASRVAARARREGSEAFAINRLVEEMVAARVVRRRNQDGEAWLELAHDFLTPEVSRWLTEEDRALQQARSVLERAAENYRTHQLVIDSDALDVLLPFGTQLGLSDEEADLLTRSLLYRGRAVPEWLARVTPSFAGLIADAAAQTDVCVRLSAVAASRYRRDEEAKRLLRRLSLWDEDLAVRKAASIALADWLQTEVAATLAADVTPLTSSRHHQPDSRRRVGAIRRAISLAMIRDYEKRLIDLSRLSALVGLLVVGGLMWVRLMRGGAAIIRQGIGGTLGAALSGVAGGFMLALALALARHAPAVEAASLLFVLISLGAFVGGIGGFGVSFGMIAASHITYRHSRWWSVVGGAAGGAAVGGVTHLLGVDIIRAVFGQNPSGVTGAFEGAVIGAGVSLGAVVMAQFFKEARPWQQVIGAALGAMAAGIALTIIGGNLFSGSLEVVARSFTDSQIRMEPLAPYFSAMRFSSSRQLLFGAIEGVMFGAGLMSGMMFFARAKSSALPDAEA